MVSKVSSGSVIPDFLMLSKWEELTQDVGTVQPAAPEMEMER